MTETAAPATVAPKQQTTEDLPVQKNTGRTRKLMIAALLFGLAIAMLALWYKKHWLKGDSEKQLAPEFEYAPLFNKDSSVVNPNAIPENETPESMLKLAKEIEASGLTIHGVTQCGWTRKQREIFGDRTAEARKVFERVYIECTTRDMCPDIRGYPSWKYGLQVFPGFKTAAQIRALIKSLQSTPKQEMLHMPSEPMEENLPEEKNAADVAPSNEELKEKKAVAKKKVAAAKRVVKKSTVTIEEIPSDSEEAAEDSDATITEKMKGKKEFIRGVSDYPPLNVPNMPGTAPMALAANNGPSHAGDQFIQGNRAPLSVSNPLPTPELSQQMAQSMEAVARDQQRSMTDSQFTKAMYPHSSTITVGDPLADKKIHKPPMKNP